MDQSEFIQRNVKAELVKQGFSDPIATACAHEAVNHFKRASHFENGGAYLECVNRAGLLAQQKAVGVKFKQVTAKRGRRPKRVQEAFKFDDL